VDRRAHVITLVGPEIFLLFAARSPTAHVLWAAIACSPCVNAYNNRQLVYRKNLCMQATTVDQVLEQIGRIHESCRNIC
jgi:hypothetical protein